MIEEAPLSDTGIQNYASRIGDGMVGPLFALAVGVYLLTGDPFRLAAILILDFATGICVSAPTTVLSAMTGAATHGLFIKGGRAMEKLAAVDDAIVVDKTGTLTRGEPIVTAVHTFLPDLTQDELLRIAATTEAKLKHPSARAVVDAAKARGISYGEATDIAYTSGMGLEATVEGHQVHVGSERYVERMARISLTDATDVAILEERAGRSLVFVLLDRLARGRSPMRIPRVRRAPW